MRTKKGQYYPRPTYTFVHPVLVIGIILVVLPFMFPVMGLKTSSGINDFFYMSGIVVIIIGGILSIIKASGGF